MAWKKSDSPRVIDDHEDIITRKKRADPKQCGEAALETRVSRNQDIEEMRGSPQPPNLKRKEEEIPRYIRRGTAMQPNNAVTTRSDLCRYRPISTLRHDQARRTLKLTQTLSPSFRVTVIEVDPLMPQEVD